MQFDHVAPGQSDADRRARRDASASLRWLARCRAEHARLAADDPDAPTRDQALFPIVQGGIHAELRARRRRAASATWATGSATASAGCRSARRSPTCTRMLDVVHEALPADRPRYLMGVGFPEDLVEGGAARRRPVRLRRADADGAQRARCSRRTAASTSATRDFRADPAPLDDGVRAARPAPASRAPTSGTSSWPTRCSGCASSACTMYISSSRSCATRGAAIAAGTFDALERGVARALPRRRAVARRRRASGASTRATPAARARRLTAPRGRRLPFRSRDCHAGKRRQLGAHAVHVRRDRGDLLLHPVPSAGSSSGSSTRR